MSRRARKIEKRVSVDPKYNSELIAHVIRVIMKDGKKMSTRKGRIVLLEEVLQ